MPEKTATSDSLEPERLTFNQTTLETKVWGCRTDDPAWDRDIDDPVAVYTPTNVPREVFDALPPGVQLVIVTERQKAGVGWRQVDRRWESYSLNHRRERRGAILPVRRTPRRRGAGRPASSRRSSARSGDSGDDGESSEPPPAGRPYEPCHCGCGRDVSHLNRDAVTATDACRKRIQRARDRANPDRALDRAVARRLEAAAAVPLLRRCRCLGGPLLPDPDPEQDLVCLACGHHCGPVRLGQVNGYDARMRDVRRLMEADVSVRRPSPAREWRTRPSRSEAAKLRKTRRTRNAAA